MGSPSGQLLADVFMGYVEKLGEDSIQKMYLYKRYVNDIGCYHLKVEEKDI